MHLKVLVLLVILASDSVIFFFWSPPIQSCPLMTWTQHNVGFQPSFVVSFLERVSAALAVCSFVFKPLPQTCRSTPLPQHQQRALRVRAGHLAVEKANLWCLSVVCKDQSIAGLWIYSKSFQQAEALQFFSRIFPAGNVCYNIVRGHRRAGRLCCAVLQHKR